jgi:hypothetical protein
MVERKQETDRFEAARRSVEDVFIRGRQFPERVFRQPFAHFGLLSFTYNTSPAIWTLFQRSAGQHGDREISVVSIDPDAFGELRETHGEAGVRSLAVLTSGDTYHRLMTDVHAKNAQGLGVVFYQAHSGSDPARTNRRLSGGHVVPGAPLRSARGLGT